MVSSARRRAGASSLKIGSACKRPESSTRPTCTSRNRPRDLAASAQHTSGERYEQPPAAANLRTEPEFVKTVERAGGGPRASGAEQPADLLVRSIRSPTVAFGGRAQANTPSGSA